MARKTQILSTFVIALVALSIYRPLFMLGFSHDDLVFLLAKNIRNDHIFDFLSHIVLSPNSYNTHYRPLGFFGYFFIMGSLFDANPVVFDIVGVGFFLISCFLFHKTSSCLFSNSKMINVLTLLYICHLGPLRMLLNYSDHVKYGLTNIILLSSLWLVVSRKNKKWADYYLLLFLNLIAILSHEAAFIFSFCLGIFSLLVHNHLSKKFLLVMLPSFIYLCARWIFWGVPSEGYFAVNWLMAPKFFLNQISFFFIPWTDKYSKIYFTNREMVSVSIIFLLVFLFQKTIVSKREKFIFLTCIFLWFLLQTPFAPIVNHWDYAKMKSLIWVTPFGLWSMYILVQKIQSLQFQRSIIIVFTLISLFLSSVVLRAQVGRKYREIVSNQSQFLMIINSASNKCEDCVFEIKNVASIVNTRDCDSYFEMVYTIPALLAHNFPQKRFKINYSNSHIMTAEVSQGYVYYSDLDKTFDIFGYPYVNEGVKIKSTTYSTIDMQGKHFIWNCEGV